MTGGQHRRTLVIGVCSVVAGLVLLPLGIRTLGDGDGDTTNMIVGVLYAVGGVLTLVSGALVLVDRARRRRPRR